MDTLIRETRFSKTLCGTCLNSYQTGNFFIIEVRCEAHKRVIRNIPEKCNKYVDKNVQTNLEGGR
jgi:hypothetical protein